MALFLTPIGLMVFGGVSSCWISFKDSAFGRVLLLRGRSMTSKGFRATRFSLTKKEKKDFRAEILRLLVRLESFFCSWQCSRKP